MTPMPQPGTKPSIERFLPDHFDPYRGDIFLFVPPVSQDGTAPEPIEMELVEVTRYRKREAPPHPEGREPFALIFRSVKGRVLAPVLHTMEHSAFESCLIFVSRIAPLAGLDRKEVCYEAVFN
jgi:hypothetical protein